MTIDRFIERLSALKDLGWTITPGGTIRTHGGLTCPVCAVHVKSGTNAWEANLYASDPLPWAILDNIVDAADGPHPSVRDLRDQILNALEL